MAKKRKKYVMTAAHKKKLIAAAKRRRGVKRGPYKVTAIKSGDKVVGFKSKNLSPFTNSILSEIARLEQQIEALKGFL